MNLGQKQREFSTDGICQIAGLIEPDAFRSLFRSFIGFCAMQAVKLGLEVERIGNDSLEDANRLVTALNDRDRWALDQASSMARYSHAGYSFVSSPEIVKTAAAFLNCPEEYLVISGPAVVANLPAKKIRLYTWHSEKYWYPKRRNFLNAWIPLSTDKRADNGTMSVLPGSHKKDWPYFSEYFGYDQDTEGNTECNLQYEIPESELTGFTPRTVEVQQGEVVLFDSNLVHRSNENISKAPSYLATIRFFDYRRDLTISASWTESPYRLSDLPRHGGRFNLRPSNVE